MRSLSSRTSWAPTSNLQRKLPTSGGGVCHGRHPLRQLGTFLMCWHLGTLLTQPRNALLATEFWTPRHPERCFQAPHLQQTTQNHSFRAGSKRSWTKRGKYEYCYHFSSWQNHPKWRPSGSARPFQLTRMAGLRLGASLLMNRFLDMFIIFLVVNTIIQATVLIFGIFCPLAYYQPPITGKKQAAAHRCGLFGVKKRR